MKSIKVVSTGHLTTVSDEYFKTYVNDGWFIEVPKKVVAKKTPAKPKE